MVVLARVLPAGSLGRVGVVRVRVEAGVGLAWVVSSVRSPARLVRWCV
jgi:hypothetical protein